VITTFDRRLERTSAAAGLAVLVAHEEALLAHGIARHLEREREVAVDVASTLGELQELLDAGPPSFLLCGDRLADGTSLAEVVALMRATQPRVRIIAVARAETVHSISQAHTHGVDGLVALDTGTDGLLETLDAVRAGRCAVPAPPEEAAEHALTPRELQLLRGLEQGLSYQEIARNLGIALSTIKTHSRPLFRKLGVSSRAAAVHRARQDGLL
jgi:DNA-binding NarL/FixJ family response regulator